MKKSLSYVFALALLFAVNAQVTAQDIHFTQFNLSPLTLNPGLTGAYEGSYRIGGIYRDQWTSVLSNPYRTPSLYVDAPIINGFKKNDWVGVGVNLLNDQVGSYALNHIEGMVSVAYHLALGKSASNIISIGLQGGYVRKTLDKTKLRFADQYVNAIYDPNLTSQDLNNVTDLEKAYPDFGAGFLLNSYINEKVNFSVGLGVFHLTEPDEAFIGSDFALPRRLSGHAEVNIGLTEKLELTPRVLYQSQSSASELNMQAMLGYALNPEKDIILKAGLGYRMDDAGMVLLGADYKSFRVGAAYDINVSDLNPISQYQGGWEVALSYVGKIFKTPIVKPVIFCPRF